MAILCHYPILLRTYTHTHTSRLYFGSVTNNRIQGFSVYPVNLPLLSTADRPPVPLGKLSCHQQWYAGAYIKLPGISNAKPPSLAEPQELPPILVPAPWILSLHSCAPSISVMFEKLCWFGHYFFFDHSVTYAGQFRPKIVTLEPGLFGLAITLSNQIMA